METWVMRQMGDQWDPDRFCPYTGRTIHPHPYFSPVGPNNGPASWRMMFWRVDGLPFRCRECTAQETAWLETYPAEFAKQDAAFHAWLSSVRKKD